MTRSKDGNSAGNPAVMTPDEAAELREQAVGRMAGAYAILNEAERDMALSEIALRVRAARAELDHALGELDEARDALVRVTADHDAAAADVERVETELRDIDPTAGTLDDQLAAHSRVYALNQVAGPLRQKLGGRQQAVIQARELVRSCEKDQLPMYRAALAAAEAALADPPMNDFAKLVEVAPLTLTVHRGPRMALAMVTPDTVRSPHGLQAVAALIPLLRASGLFDFLRDYFVDSLKGKVDAKTLARVRRAFAPPEPDLYQPEPPAHGPGPLAARTGDLPAYDSAAGQAIRSARPPVGPASWPAFNGMRADAFGRPAE